MAAAMLAWVLATFAEAAEWFLALCSFEPSDSLVFEEWVFCISIGKINLIMMVKI